jgi:hypothetical protein
MPRPRTTHFRRPALLALALLLLVPAGSMALAAGNPAKPQYPITLKFIGAVDGNIQRETGSGWPITMRLTSNGELGIGTPFRPPIFPRFQEVGYVVFADPDNCFSLGLGHTCASTDETYLEFTPDLDLPGIANPHGNPDRLIALTESGGGGSPRILAFDVDTHLNDLLVPYGPEVGGADTLEYRCAGPLEYAGPACTQDSDCFFDSKCRLLPVNADGYGYGPDDDLPGLVLLSDTGVGLVLDENFNRPRVLQERNLAGLLNSVAYDLKDGSHRTTVLAHMNVPHGRQHDLRTGGSSSIPSQLPRGLFTPMVLADRCVGTVPACGTNFTHIFRIDGGPQVSMEDHDMLDLLNAKVVTLRAFVVNGTAPSVLSDLNGDGFVGAKDAVLAGYQLLSGEESVRFVGFYDDELEVLPLLFDFDGNGDAVGLLVAPGGAGQITKVPE